MTNTLPSGYAVNCDTCGLQGEPQPTPEAAELLAGRHDDMRHQGVPTADIHRCAAAQGR